MKNYQAIFQIKIDGKWMDFAREQVKSPADAEPMMKSAARREGKPFRVTVEHWNEYPEKREENVRYGDW
jgi:hypothetical protein